MEQCGLVSKYCCVGASTSSIVGGELNKCLENNIRVKSAWHGQNLNQGPLEESLVLDQSLLKFH